MKLNCTVKHLWRFRPSIVGLVRITYLYELGQFMVRTILPIHRQQYIVINVQTTNSLYKILHDNFSEITILIPTIAILKFAKNWHVKLFNITACNAYYYYYLMIKVHLFRISAYLKLFVGNAIYHIIRNFAAFGNWTTFFRH